MQAIITGKIVEIGEVRKVKMGLTEIECRTIKISFPSKSGKEQVRRADVLREAAEKFGNFYQGERLSLGDIVTATVELKGKEKYGKTFNSDEIYSITKA